MPASTLSDDAIDAPLRIGRYETLLKIGTGGMANVYLGRAQGLAGFERLVAIKCCHPHLRDDEHFATMFLDEARLAARIHHPNVVATIDVGEDHRRLFLVMDYVEGGRLLDLMRERAHADATVPTAIALRIMIDALVGLHAAHELRGADGTLLDLVHRDVSPQNVLVGTDGVARITDFGIARAGDSSHTTREDARLGKVSYMAPEQVLGTEVSRRTDVFAAGIVLWELLTGQRLFAGPNHTAIAQRVVGAPIEPPSSRAAGLASGLDAIVMRALERDPAQRFPTALAFAEALESAGASLATTRGVGAFVEQVLGSTLAERSARARARVPALRSDTRGDEPTAFDAARPAGASRRALWLAGLAGCVALALLGAGALRARAVPRAVITTPSLAVHTPVAPAPAPPPAAVLPAPTAVVATAPRVAPPIATRHVHHPPGTTAVHAGPHRVFNPGAI